MEMGGVTGAERHAYIARNNKTLYADNHSPEFLFFHNGTRWLISPNYTMPVRPAIKKGVPCKEKTMLYLPAGPGMV